MKKVIFSAIVMAFLTVSCNQKAKETETTDESHTMGNDNTMMDNDTTMTDHSKMKEDKMYACPMHPEVTGKKGDKCTKCGMVLTGEVNK